MMLKLAKICYKRAFRGSSKKIVAPPGEIIELGRGRPIIIASFPRSGTHIMIDSILNNFPHYRNIPLYLDFDQFSNSRYKPESVLDEICNSRLIIKTHYPHRNLYTHEDDITSSIERLIEKAFVIKVERDKQRIKASYEKGFGKVSNIECEIELFDEYWQNKADIIVNFNELVNKDTLPKVIEQISDKLNEEHVRKVIFPPPPDAFLQVGVQKIATRLLGKRTPFSVNTTIQFKN